MAATGTGQGAKHPRPLSPQIQVYTPLINMVMSILHRITGAALYFGTLLLAWWLIAAASGPRAFGVVSAVMGSWFGLLVLFLFTLALFIHMLGGIRYLIWDSGRFMGKGERDTITWASLGIAVVLTIVVWIAVMILR